MLTDLDFKALSVGAFIYLMSVVMVSGFMTLTANINFALFESVVFHLIYWLVGIIMFSVGGFFSGYMAGRRGVLHGMVVGIVGTLLAVLFLSFHTRRSRSIGFHRLSNHKRCSKRPCRRQWRAYGP